MPKAKGKMSKYGWPKKMVAVMHGSNSLDLSTGQHRITVTRTGSLNAGKHTVYRGLFRNAVKRGKQIALKMGEGTGLWVHGSFASEKSVDYQVQNGRLVILKHWGYAK